MFTSAFRWTGRNQNKHWICLMQHELKWLKLAGGSPLKSNTIWASVSLVVAAPLWKRRVRRSASTHRPLGWRRWSRGSWASKFTSRDTSVDNLYSCVTENGCLTKLLSSAAGDAEQSEKTWKRPSRNMKVPNSVSVSNTAGVGSVGSDVGRTTAESIQDMFVSNMIFIGECVTY